MLSTSRAVRDDDSWVFVISSLSEKSFCVFLAACLAASGLGGCKKEEGPAEKLGKEAYKAVTEAGDKLKEATKQK
jgi:hypothetical protein